MGLYKDMEVLMIRGYLFARSIELLVFDTLDQLKFLLTVVFL